MSKFSCARWRRAAGVAALATMGVAAAACGGAAKPASGGPSGVAPVTASAQGTPYVVRGMLSLTGTSAVLGKTEMPALQALEKLVNAQGGIGGHPLRFQIEDDESSPKVAVQLASEMIQQHVPIIFGSDLVGACLAEFPLTKQGPLVYCNSPGVHPPGGSFDFSAGISTRVQVEAILNYLKARGVHRIALLTSTDASGVDGRNEVLRALKTPDYQSFQLVGNETYPVNATSVATQLTRIRAGSPQALILWSSPGAAAGVAYESIHGENLQLPVYTDEGNTLADELRSFHNILPAELYSADPAFDAVQTLPARYVPPQEKAAVDLFLKTFGPEADVSHALAWDPGLILVHVLRQVGAQADASQIRDAILHLRNFYGAFGVYNFSPNASENRGTGLEDVFVCRWDASKGQWIAVSGPGGTPVLQSSASG